MGSKIKILQFPIRNSNGGVTHYAVNNYRNINKDIFMCDFATVSPKLDFEDDLISMGANVKYVSCYAEENEKQFKKDMYDILSGGYDIVHLHTSYWKSFLVEEIAKECNIPKIIVHSHSTHVTLNSDYDIKKAEMVHNSIKNQFDLSMATDFCACSSGAADWLFGSQIPRKKIRIMKNAINIEPFIYDKSASVKLRYDLGLEDSFVIGNVGRFICAKNHEFLIRVFAQVSRKNDRARLLLVGDGALRNDMENLTESLKIKDKVIFTGARNDVNCLLQAMDLFCLPSRFEGLPIVAIEAQTAGLKCLISDKITDEVCITFNAERLPLDENIWVEHIQKYSDGYERKNMYDEITDAGYNIKYQIKEVEKLYSGETL